MNKRLRKKLKKRMEKALKNQYIFEEQRKVEILEERKNIEKPVVEPEIQSSQLNKEEPVKPRTKNQKEYLRLINTMTGHNYDKYVFPKRITATMLEQMYYQTISNELYEENIINNFEESFLDGWNATVSTAIKDIIDGIRIRVGVKALAQALMDFDYDLAYFFQSAWEDSDQPYKLFEQALLQHIPFVQNDELEELNDIFDREQYGDEI